MKKPLLLILLCACLLVSLAACVPQGVNTVSQAQEPVSLPTSAEGEQNAAKVSQSPLTGLPTEASEGSYPVAVVVNRVLRGASSRGLSQADLVFEVDIFEGIPRCIALYGDYKAMPVVGPVRELFAPLMPFVLPANPLFVSTGVTLPATQLIDQLDLSPLVFAEQYGQDAVWFIAAQFQDVPGEYCSYADGANLAGATQFYRTDLSAAETEPFFNFKTDENDGSAGDWAAAETLTLAFSSIYQTRFVYDEASGRYQLERLEAHTPSDTFTPAMDENTETQLAFDNVLVLFADVIKHEWTEENLYKDQLEIQYANGGSGYYCHGGEALPLNWSKPGPTDHFSFTANGAELAVHPGTTYVAVVWNSQKESCTIGEQKAE